MLTQKLIDFLACKNVCQSLASSYVRIPEIVKDYSDGVLKCKQPTALVHQKNSKIPSYIELLPFLSNCPSVGNLGEWSSNKLCKRI
jgi:hypothetical protein